MWKFADDTKLAGRVGSMIDIEALRDGLRNLENWTERWQMPMNSEKCKVMHIGNKNNKYKTEYKIGDKKLGVVTDEKDLEVIISNDLKVAKQCIKSANKGNQILGMISRYFTCRNKDIIIRLYKTLVRPNLEYCGQVWRAHCQKDIDA